MTYSVVFEMTSQSYPAPIAPLVAVGLPALGLAAGAVWLYIARRNSPLARQARFYSAGIAAGLCVILFAMYCIKSSYDRLMEAVRSGNVKVVEGIVENFHPMPATGHDTERFTVSGERFAYSDYEKTGGFNNAASHGGPMRPGLPVRITFVQQSSGNVIVKLEVGRI